MNQHPHQDLQAPGEEADGHGRPDAFHGPGAAAHAAPGRVEALFAAALEGDPRAAAQLRAIAGDPTAPDTDGAADALGALAQSDALAVERLLEAEPDLHSAARTADADQTAAAVLAALNHTPRRLGQAQPGTGAPGPSGQPEASD